MLGSKIKPLGNRILVKRSEAKTSRGGILLPESSKEKPKQGQVIAVGSGKVDELGHIEKMHVKVGDLVLFGSYSGTQVQLENQNDDTYLIMSEDEVLAVIA